jgi:hypothetical protein
LGAVTRTRGNDGDAGDESDQAKPLAPEIREALSGLYAKLTPAVETAGTEEEDS